MSTAGRSAANSQIASLMKTAEAARVNAETQLDGFRANRRASKESIQDARARIKSIRVEQSVQQAAMQAQIARINNTGKASSEQRRRQINSLRQVRQAQKAVAATEIADLEKTVLAHQSKIMSYDREVAKIQEVKRASDAQTKSELNGIRQKMRAEEAHIQKVQDAAHAQFGRGAAIATVGVAMTGVGIAGAAALNKMTVAAQTYNQESAKTLTQVDGLNFSLQDIKKMGQDLASDFPVKMEEVQGALYDVFSSMDFHGKNTEKQVLDIYQGIGKAAVAGATKMEVAGRGIIAIMNAWNLKGKDVDRVNDVMFKLVQKGVGTYDEFAKAIGRAVPSAKKSGQSIEDLAGMMAFLTRNGLSTQMAATSAARALDAISKTQTQDALKKIGVQVTDTNGKFRPMSVIAEELQDKLKGLSDKARATKLNNIFGRGSGGTIQAMRFFNLATTDTSGLLQNLTGDMNSAKGATEEAYKIMSNTPEAKLQAMNNQYQIMSQRLGDALIPLKLALVTAITDLLKWFNNLSPAVQRFIGIAVAVTSGLLILGGIVLTVVGGLSMLAATATLAGGAAGLGAMLTPVGWVVAALAALIAIGILVAQNWDAIAAKANDIWGGMQRSIQPFVEQFMKALEPLKAGWDAFMTAIQPGIQALMAAFNNLGNAIGPILNWIIGILGGPFLLIWNIVVSTIGGALGGLGTIFSGVMILVSGFINFISALFTGQWGALWESVKQILWGAWQIIIGLFQTVGGIIGGIVSGLIRGIIGFFTYLYDVIVGHSIVPDMVNAIIRWFAMLPGRVISGIASLAGMLFNTAKGWFTRMMSAASDGWNAVNSFFKGIPGKIVSALGNVGGILYNAGKGILEGFLNGLRSIWDNIQNFVGSIAGWIRDHKGPLSYDYGLLQPAGRKIMEGLDWAMRKRFGDIKKTVGEINNLISTDGSGTFNANDFGPRPPGSGGGGYPSSSGVRDVNMTVHTQEINPRKHAADLAFIVANDLGF